MAENKFLRALGGLTRVAANAATSTAQNPTGFIDRVNATNATQQNNASNKRLNALKLESAELDLDNSRKEAPLRLSAQENALEKAGVELGFLKDKVKRKRALEDASLLSLAQGDPEAQARILRQRIIGLVKENPDVDLNDSMTALNLLKKDPAAFNKGVARTLKVGQLLGDITPQKDNRTDLERNATFAGTPKGRADIEALSQAKAAGSAGPKKTLQAKEVTIDGKPELRLFDPSTGEFIKPPEGVGPALKKGQKISVDKDGNITIEEGVGLGQEATAPVKTDLQKKIVNNQATMARLQRVGEQFNGKFLTFKGRALNSIFKTLDKMQVGELSNIPLIGKAFDGLDSDQKQSLKEFSAFQRNVEEAFAQFGKSISGAAISEKEFERLQKAFVNVKQSPTQFKSVLNETLDTFERSNRIFQKVLEKGFDPSTKEGGKVFDDLFSAGKGQTMMERGRDLNEALKNQFSDSAQRKEAVLEMLQEEGFEINGN